MTVTVRQNAHDIADVSDNSSTGRAVRNTLASMTAATSQDPVEVLDALVEKAQINRDQAADRLRGAQADLEEAAIVRDAMREQFNEHVRKLNEAKRARDAVKEMTRAD